MGHEAADEVDVTAEAVQLGDGHMALESLRGCQGGLELRPAVEGVGALAGLDLHELPGQLQALGFREVLKDCRWASMPSPERPCWDVRHRM